MPKNVGFSAHVRMCNAAYGIRLSHHVKFYFRFRQLIGLPVWGQFCCGCKSEESSTFVSGNIQYTFQYYMSPFCRSSSFFRWSSFYRLSSFLRSSSFFSLSSFFWLSSFLGCLHFRGCLHFEVIFLIYPLIRATFFYSIKIRLETPKIKFFYCIGNRKKTECDTTQLCFAHNAPSVYCLKYHIAKLTLMPLFLVLS